MERTGPVLALINERNQQKEESGTGLMRIGERDLEKMGTSDGLVGLVAGMAKTWAMSRRGIKG